MSTTEIPEQFCPNCGKLLDEIVPMTPERIPSRGSVTICWYCCAVLIFTEALELRMAVKGDLTPELQRQVFRLQEQILAAREAKN